jgi:hypothetical protein
MWLGSAEEDLKILAVRNWRWKSQASSRKRSQGSSWTVAPAEEEWKHTQEFEESDNPQITEIKCQWKWIKELSTYFYFYSCRSHLLHSVSVERLISLSVGHLGRGISPSQGLYLHPEQNKHRIKAAKHPCLEWD